MRQGTVQGEARRSDHPANARIGEMLMFLNVSIL